MFVFLSLYIRRRKQELLAMLDTYSTATANASSVEEEPNGEEDAPLNNNNTPQQPGARPENVEEEPVIIGTKFKWQDLKLGMFVMVARRETINTPKSDWVPAMDDVSGYSLRLCFPLMRAAYTSIGISVIDTIIICIQFYLYSIMIIIDYRKSRGSESTR